MTPLEKVELACHRVEASLGPLEFETRRALKALIKELVRMNNEYAQVRK